MNALQLNNNAVLLLQSDSAHHGSVGAATLKQAMTILQTEFEQAPVALVGNQHSLPPQVEISISKISSSDAVQPNANIVGGFFLFQALPSAPQETSDHLTETLHEASAATYLAVCLYNMALSRHLQYCRRQMPENILQSTAVLYKTAYHLLTGIAHVNGEDSAALVVLATCTNLHALYLELGDLRQAHSWQSQLTQNGATIHYHQAKFQAQGVADDALRTVHLTASVYGFFAAGAA